MSLCENEPIQDGWRYNPGTMSLPKHTITLAPLADSFSAAEATTLLHALEAAGFDMPSSCRNGTCRTCLCRVAEGAGRVRHLVEWPGLSLEEKRDGYILPCIAVALEDLTLEQRLAKRTGRPD